LNANNNAATLRIVPHTTRMNLENTMFSAVFQRREKQIADDPTHCAAPFEPCASSQSAGNRLLPSRVLTAAKRLGGAARYEIFFYVRASPVGK
jgi:hypothetical protein